ncbi:hypothetical protein, conserved [Trypanosoma cruzi]|uniref:t-SNARE coiled-coil homology domain-containing protein n=2 Tax=Trypanosoma cruzi TaxID=5693 RepID=Q4DYJ5_TRYCC|nr:hypothetical protein, conserved [Trypanosoma cruzi]EAN97614.1 hypothetical protein, conserved [Trypanosoma cruzi]|eukprot:XP_819465.1 hypothetical protein [Trypanosoma cruzi strain CL Brener]
MFYFLCSPASIFLVFFSPFPPPTSSSSFRSCMKYLLVFESLCQRGDEKVRCIFFLLLITVTRTFFPAVVSFFFSPLLSAVTHEMPLDEGEALLRAVHQVRKACSDVSSATAELGTARDAMAREKLRKSRLLVTQCEEKAGGILAAGIDAELSALRGQYNAVRADFDRVNREAIRREKQTWRPLFQNDAVEGDGRGDASVSPAAQNSGRVQEIRAIDMSGLCTEEALQREKLLGVREIESNMMDLRSMYQEFHDLVHHQQSNLDSMTGNVSVAKSSVEGGARELSQASRRQKCGRKLLCTVAIILFIVIIGVVVVVLVAKS